MRNFVNETYTPAYKTPGICIIQRIMKIPGVWYAAVKILFTKLRIFLIGIPTKNPGKTVTFCANEYILLSEAVEDF